MGPAVADALASRGARVAVAYRQSAEEAAAVVRATQAHGRDAFMFQTDVSSESGVEALMAEVSARFGRLDVLVNMASLYRKTAFPALSLAEWRLQIGVDLEGTFLLCRAAVPLMQRSGGGRIINFTDWIAASGRPRYREYVAYYVAKAGVKALTEALALELASDGILVNAIAPGPILAPDDTSVDERAAVERATPLGRWGGAEEIAKAVVALVDSDFITGETIRVDGGRHVY